ncbi:2-hydroxyglutaryl-CoA dehydratase [candidate division WOR-3 bacterium]|nr:2-hydroxyglutaryl-CoA dehydratase [candidate division WOR-3 bacterium]
MKCYLGIDVGSISAKGVVIDDDRQVISDCYLRTLGNPIAATKDVLRNLRENLPPRFSVRGSATTGSARRLAGIMINADIVKNEIIAHAVAACHRYKGVQTIIEIGGQDSKLIIIRDSIPVDFAMNTVCAAGTGSFLDHQAIRLGLPIEEFGKLALKADNPVHIASRCTVFAESDMIHKTQLGIERNDIVAGLCEAIVRNYLNVLAKGKEMKSLILFQGGVAANTGVKVAFEKALGMRIEVPEYFLVMGAIGAALLARFQMQGPSKFIGFDRSVDQEFQSRGFECPDCPNQCEIVEAVRDGEVVARYGSRCGKWE